MASTTPLFNPNDGLVGRDGGPYLDQEEARIAEERRARIEGREPDFDNPPATAGIPLSPASTLIYNLDIQQPSKDTGLNTIASEIFESRAKSEDNLLQVQGEIDNDLVQKMKETDESDEKDESVKAPVKAPVKAHTSSSNK